MTRILLPSNVVPIHYDVEIVPRVSALAFKGRSTITIKVLEPTSIITLNSVELEFEATELRSSHGVRTGTPAMDAGSQRVNLHFDELVEPGIYDLAINYLGKINESAEGLFITRYDTAAGPRHMLLTQFEAVAARRFMPCWDEPAHKATFTVSVAASANETVLSNMPIERTEASESGFRLVRFQRTPVMSCYLLFLCVGELDRLETNAGGVAVSVLSRAGSSHKGQFALESAVKLLEYYNDYFGTPYPLPKLDLLAAPGGGGFSAMENWGAILYFETSLLIDPMLSTESDRQRVFVVVAHEMAHQWFGNLVTMQWWDNLWLNEGFASWMENKATDKFYPQWMMWLQSESARQRAMKQDSRATTHPVVQEIESGEQADQAFDDITYQKGQAVIRMLENYVGEDVFRQGVRTYMKRYAYKNTVTDDLWAELTAAGAKDIKTIADDFTLQAGVPLISVEGAANVGDAVKLSVRQSRFGLDVESRKPLVWHVPVIVASVRGDKPATSIITSSLESMQADVAGTLPIKINYGQGAYYRSKYSGESFQQLAGAFDQLAPGDQLGLLYDVWSLGEAGESPIAAYLDLTRQIKVDAHTVIWSQVIETLLSIDGLYWGLGGRQRFDEFAIGILKPAFARIGWDRRSGEADNVAVLREQLIGALGRLGDRAVIDEAQTRFAGSLAHPDDPGSLPSSIRQPVLRVVGLRSDLSVYDRLYELAKATVDPVAKDQYFMALAGARNTDLAARSLDIALGKDPATATGPTMISRVAGENAPLAWTFVLSHLKELNAKLDAMQRVTFVPSIGALGLDASILKQLREFIDVNVPEANKAQVERFYTGMAFRLSVREKRIPEIDAWLAASS
ncbi:M1 family metallopeptidase [Bradyrhizobium sp. SZCCHNS3002]|uniref:M1 family metallopeptidase n=1 Tax=Bradyrhizobium sp. SZCCHNS3002 TaxID=3057310 RepID=UPI0028EDA866|nr:M1 family metallopeptidase [Bradyrhizobium sp. SZCCHNS3002]